MFLTQANLLHYLVEKQFAELEIAVAGKYSVRPLTRRNLVFHVRCGAREYLVKQAKRFNWEARFSVEREAAFYKLKGPGQPPVPLAPECYAYDPPNSVLILEFLREHIELYDSPDRFTSHVAGLCGEVMGTFHQQTGSRDLASSFPGTTPWFLSFHEMPEEELRDSSAAQRELARVVKRNSGFGRALDRLRAGWRADTLTHGDWKLENCLVSPDRKDLRVVDWEFVSWGDFIWDVSALLQSYWNFWVRWPLEYPIASIQPALRAFLGAYTRARGYHLDEFAARAIHFAGARMLQSAYEVLDKVEQMSGEAVRLMQGSLNILTRPDWAAKQLIGTF